MKVSYAVKNVMNIEKSIVKNVKIDTTRNKEEDMKKMKSIEKESRDKEDYLKVKLFSVLLVKSQWAKNTIMTISKQRIIIIEGSLEV